MDQIVQEKHSFKIVKGSAGYAKNSVLTITISNGKRCSIRHQIISEIENRNFIEDNQIDFEHLGDLELSILKLMSSGLSDKEIGINLSKNPFLIQEYRLGIIKKLKISSMHELVDFIVAFELY